MCDTRKLFKIIFKKIKFCVKIKICIKILKNHLFHRPHFSLTILPKSSQQPQSDATLFSALIAEKKEFQLALDGAYKNKKEKKNIISV